MIGFISQLGSEKATKFFGNKNVIVDDGVVFSADLAKTNAKTRSGHSYAGNKQLHDLMSADQNLRKKMESILGVDVYERTSTSGKGRRNPYGFEWDHNTNNPNQLDLRSKENHSVKTSNDPGRAGGYSKYWKENR